MPASQLKQLKASLREQGITGQQRSKKQRKRTASAANGQDQSAKRAAALAQIRDNFNPFDVRQLGKPAKFDITSSKTLHGPAVAGNGRLGRPAVTKSYGEQTRRHTLLPEIHRRNKVGGVLDRRIGEHDPTMTPEDRAEMRFARAARKGKAGTFDLDLDSDTETALTHLGRSLADDDADDFAEHISQASSDLEDEGLSLKRKQLAVEDTMGTYDDTGDLPARKKSKAEVMKEVIAKSKLHKYERQQAKEDDDDLREELDRGMGELMSALQTRSRPKAVAAPAIDIEASINPDRLALLNGADRSGLDQEYDTRIRQMTLDQRAQPTDRTKTEEERAQEQAEHLRLLEEARLRRMRGESPSESEGADEPEHIDSAEAIADQDDAFAFGLDRISDKNTRQHTVLDVEDEDDFLIDSDLVADDSDLGEDDDSVSNISSGSENNSNRGLRMEEEGDDELISGLLSKDEQNALQKRQLQQPIDQQRSNSLAFAYSCPTSHSELLTVLGALPHTELPIGIQRIRALHDPRAAPENKAKLAEFAAALVSHIVYLGDMHTDMPLDILDTVIRHVHSLSRTFADRVSEAFRTELRAADDQGLTPGRLCLLTAIGTVYPTSDHFHQVVTPAITIMARWLGLTTPKTLRDLSIGAYLGALCVKYQQLSKRYIPELLKFHSLALRCPQSTPGLLAILLANVSTTMELWADKSAFAQAFAGLRSPIKQCKHQSAPGVSRKLNILLQQARQSRRPLELHHHRALPIKTAIPLFEDNFNPGKHYDPNFARSEASRLKSEYKRERKGALRELRKDANFVARERLREKRERDRLHEEKEKRIVAEINAEGGQERNEYERERKRRRGR